jgi:adenosine deaminase
MKSYDYLKNMPKVELHTHLLGCFAISDLWVLAQKYYPSMTKGYFDKIFDFHNFSEFSVAWKFKNSFIKTYADFSFLMDGVVNYAKQENIIYWEPAIALFELAPLDPAKLLDLAYNKLKTSGIEFSFIMDLIRGDGKKQLNHQYNFYNNLSKNYNIRGVGLAGNEEKHGLKTELASIFEKAKSDGYGVTIHAGETGPSANIKTGIETFGADRIGHANYINLYVGRDLGDMIIQNKVHLEFMPKTFTRFGGYGSNSVLDYLRADTLNRAHGAEIPIFYNFSINSDDHGMFNESLTNIIDSIGCNNHEHRWLMRMANDASFATAETKQFVNSKLCEFTK